MRYVETENPDKYECYGASNNGSIIAKCMMAGSFMFTFSLSTPKVYAAPIHKAPIEWKIDNHQAERIQIETVATKPLIDIARLSCIVKIDQIGQLQQNWNGCGAEKPNKDAVKNARHLIEILDKEMLKSLHPDDIYASDYGSVILDFGTHRGLVSVEMGDTTMGFYTDFTESENYAAEGISTDFMSVPKTLESYLS